MSDTNLQTLRDRAMLAAIGALAGLAFYLLVDFLPDRLNDDRLLLLIVALTGGFFAVLLAAIGPLRLPTALNAAVGLSVPSSLLLWWASGRFDTVDGFMQSGFSPVAFAVMATIALPFVIAALRPQEGWRDYPALFTHSWNIVVRYAASWLFVGLFWGVVFLSNALLNIVGLTVIEDLLGIEAVPFVLTGAVLGLALAVIYELAEYVSPFLLLRLLRLLLPVVLVVTAVFLLALPIQGLSGLFGGLSPAATLMAMALGATTLVTTALDRNNDEAVHGSGMRNATRALALLLPAMAGVAIYAVWLRVDQYGWTPARLAAMSASVILGGYALSYALAVLLRRHWMDRIRQANIWMALVTILIAALWLTPVLNPERISAVDQVARFQDGKTPLADLDLWTIGREWGGAGQAALLRLAELDHPDKMALGAQLEALSQATSEGGFRSGMGSAAEVDVVRIRASLTIVPEGAEPPDSLFQPGPQLEQLNEACQRRSPAGNPGCLALISDFVAGNPGPETIVLMIGPGNRLSIEVRSADTDQAWRNGRPTFLSPDVRDPAGPELIDRIVAGDYQIVPAPVMMLQSGDIRFLPLP